MIFEISDFPTRGGGGGVARGYLSSQGLMAGNGDGVGTGWGDIADCGRGSGGGLTPGWGMGCAVGFRAGQLGTNPPTVMVVG